MTPNTVYIHDADTEPFVGWGRDLIGGLIKYCRVSGLKAVREAIAETIQRHGDEQQGYVMHPETVEKLKAALALLNEESFRP